MPVPQSFADARATLKSMRAATASALYARTVAQQNLDAALRSGDAGAISTAQSTFDGAKSDLATARGNEAGARTALNSLISGWLAVPGTSNPVQYITPDADFARMELVGNPVAMFPVRLETRFDVTNAILHVRVYPDEFFSDIHERELTPDEHDAGIAYWNNQPATDERTDPAFVDRWSALTKRYGVPRAAYIARVMTPPVTNPPSPRATVPSRGAEAVLPDRWVALAYKNGQLRHFVPGLPIPEPIDLTANPSADDQTMSEVADGFNVPSNILWTMRYDIALANGMAIDIGGLASDELTGGFDRVVVLGVKTSMDPEDSFQLISDLFDAHHYTRGLDLVPLGTPTNNIPGLPTPFTMKDPPGAESFQIERIGPGGEPEFNPDYVALAELFGFDSSAGPFTFLAGSLNGQHDIFTGADMRRAVWPATLGYFLRQMMNPPNGTPIFAETTFQAAKAFFLTYVSAQGPAPAFRVGAVPYGLLPAISYSRMKAQTTENGDAMAVIQKLVPFWLDAVPTVLTVPRDSQDRNTDLMNVISQKSSADGVFIRNSIGPDTVTNLFQFILEDWSAIYAALAQLPSTTLGALGHTDWAKARIFEILFSATTALYGGPLVTAHPQQGMLVSAVSKPDPNRPTDTLNYLTFLGDTRLDFGSVQGQGSMGNAAPPNELLPLLFLVARHSLLLESIEVGRASSVLSSAFSRLRVADVELWRILSTSETDIIDVLGGPSPSTSRPVFQSVVLNSDGKTTVDPGTRDTSPVFPQIQSALQRLSFLSVAELERVFTESLDLAAHRLDAYVTAMATRRLLTLRRSIVIGLRAQGVTPDEPTTQLTYFGGYGVVEDVRPVTRTTRSIDGIGTVDVQLDNGGYIHAPSPRHATAAAILRSGRMAENSDPTKYAIELPSDRARRARLLVDGVRNGQPLGELLGFELETNLRARAQTDQITGMEGYILALRRLYPLVANKSGLDPGQPADGIAAANVVDGQLVRNARSQPGGIPFGTGGLPAPSSTDAGVIRDEVDGLDELVDAIGDLEISEAVLQVAAGDVASAEAAMNFLPTGSNPPQSEVTNSPTAGIPVSHRVALLLEGDAPAATGWTLVGAQPKTSLSLRGQVDTFAEAWVGTLLGNPSGATATVTYQLNGLPQTASVAVSDIKTLGPLEFLALAQSTSSSGQGSPLDRQLAAALKAKVPGATGIAVTGYDAPGSGPSIPQLIEMGRALGAVLGGARELAPADLVLTPDDVNDPSLDPSVVSGQATDAINALDTLVQSFDTADPRTVLATASLYQAEAFPDPSGADSDLAVQIMNAKGELGRRVTDARAAAVGISASNADKIAAAINQLRIVFGRNTLVVLPAAIPPGSGELQQSLVALDHPLDLSNPDPSLDLTKPETFAPHQAPGRYLQQALRVHERLGPWRKFSLYAGAFGTPSPRVSAAQLPFVDGEEWVGRVAPTDSRTSLLFISANGQTVRPDATQVWRGLLLDQWTELVPGTTTETGLAFHYDSQNSEAPQVILMAMHSGQTNGWNLAELAAIVTETIDLALIRPVDSDRVGLGQLVPPICLASNSTNRVVSTNIGPEARENVPIVVT